MTTDQMERVRQKAREHRNDRADELTSVSIAHDIGYEAGYLARDADTLRHAAQLIPSTYQHGDSPSAWLTRRANEMERQ